VSGAQVVFRVAYSRYSELRDDVTQQMARGGLLVKIADATGLTLDTPVRLELVLPDGTPLQTATHVLLVLAGYGVAVSVDADLVAQARRAASGLDPSGSGLARHERIDTPSLPRQRQTTPPPTQRARTSTPPPLPIISAPLPDPPAAEHEGPSRIEKIQLALHGTRDERNVILRDRDRTLHPFVLKNPQLSADDIVTIAKNAQMSSDLLQQIGDRKEWLQRPAVALSLARNPKTPPDLAVRALDHVPLEALRQMCKGAGVPPHVTQAARRKLLR
jgi:hypothetical protein